MIPAILCGFILFIVFIGLIFSKIQNKQFKLSTYQKIMLGINIIFYLMILYLSLTNKFLS